MDNDRYLTSKMSVKLMKYHQKVFLNLVFLTCGSIFTMCCIVSTRYKNRPTADFNNKEYISELKYILMQTRSDYAPFSLLKLGQQSFINTKCSVVNCFLTDNESFFGAGIEKFDAIIFNGRNLKGHSDIVTRSEKQTYVFIMSESADNHPVCNSKFDNFFNLTMTYRLDSDYPMTYFFIRNVSNGQIVGPRHYMNWVPNMKDVDYNFYYNLQNKNKMVAWFVSNCYTRNGRERFVEQIQRSLKQYGVQVDIYGKCGDLRCDQNTDECNTMLRQNYFFYLSFENSFSEDYVTEKVLTAVQNDVVPIVYGGAQYSRFLPPGSYINAREYTPDQLAALMVRLRINLSEYAKFFRWRNYYSFSANDFSPYICQMCEALNNKTISGNHQLYMNFRRWWLPDFEDRC